VLLVTVIGYSSRFVLFQPWSSRSAMTITAAADEAELFVIGGRRTNETLLNDVLTLDFDERRIVTAATHSAPLLGASAAVRAGKAYIIGGSYGSEPLARIAVLQPETSTLNTVGRLPFPISHSSAVNLRDGIYIFGGWDGERKRAEIYRFKPEEGTVEPAGTLPEAREKLAAAVVSGEVYLMGGYNRENEGDDTIWRYRPERETCSAAVTLPEPIERVSAAAIRGSLLYLTPGGNRSSTLYRLSPSSESPKAEQWTLPLSARKVELAALGDKLYAVGGAHPKFERQIGAWSIAYDTAGVPVEALRLRGYSWN